MRDCNAASHTPLPLTDRSGGNSGAGTYGTKGDIKAHITNRFIRKLGIEEVVEMGFGDGHAVGLGDYKKYVGTDVSTTAYKKVHTHAQPSCGRGRSWRG